MTEKTSSAPIKATAQPAPTPLANGSAGQPTVAAAKPDSEKSAETLAKETSAAAKSRSEEIKEKAKVEARELSGKARSVAEAKAEEAKTYATSEIERQAEYIRNAGRDYGEDSYQAHAADYVASNLHQAATVIRDRDVSSLMNDVTSFARRNPAMFLGGAAILGFAAARLLKASERSGISSQSTYRERYEPVRSSAMRPAAYGDRTAQAVGRVPR